ncbi:hypothetical protein DXG01_013088 [Tephrocybe rancida]|nr:hypothetical protein DXG01_013088 [Tephrocybe rancida]
MGLITYYNAERNQLLNNSQTTPSEPLAFHDLIANGDEASPIRKLPYMNVQADFEAVRSTALTSVVTDVQLD